MTEWPLEGDLVVPLEAAPPALTKGMGENWRRRKAYEQAQQEAAAEDG